MGDLNDLFTSHPVLEAAGWALDGAGGDSTETRSWSTVQTPARRSLHTGVWAPVGNVLAGPEPRKKVWQKEGKQPWLAWDRGRRSQSALVICWHFPKSLQEGALWRGGEPFDTALA